MIVVTISNETKMLCYLQTGQCTQCKGETKVFFFTLLTNRNRKVNARYNTFNVKPLMGAFFLTYQKIEFNKKISYLKKILNSYEILKVPRKD